MYVTAAEIYSATSLDSSVVPEAAINTFIKSAEKEVDRFTFTTYWATDTDTQTTTSSTSTIVTVSGASYTPDDFIGMYLWVYSGTAEGQIRKIIDNDATTITVDEAFDTTPDANDLFRIIYTATDPHVDEAFDGNDMKFYFLPEYPLKELNTLTIDGDSITKSSIYFYNSIGKIQLSDTSEKSRFTDWKPQTIALDYWYGVYPIPYEVKRAVTVIAAMKTLGAQTGGTYNVPSTYSLPEGSVTIGQAYVNIRETFNMLNKEWESLKYILIKYPKVI